MKCGKCGRENPVSTLYCVGCGGKMDLSQQTVHASIRKEISLERARNLESTVRSLVAIALVVAVVAAVVKRRTDALPDPDLLPVIAMPPLAVGSGAMIDFEEEGISPMPSLEVPAYIPSDPYAVKKAVSELRKRVFALNNVVLILKNPPNAKVKGRLLGKDDKYYYIIDSFTSQENRIEVKDVQEVKKEENPAPDKGK